MNRFFSRRPFALLLAAVAFLALAATAAQAEQRAYQARGTAQFGSANSFVGAGTATHLGRYEEQGSASFFATADPAVFLVEASATYTAANGDELWAVFTGHLDFVTGEITATVTYVGGTGRFADAGGTATLSGQRFDDGSIEVDVEGTIDF